jgi:hypothetical protein
MTTDAEEHFLFLDVERRGVIFRRALVRSKLGERKAIELLSSIKLVWAYELQELKDIPNGPSPDPGMLKALGYCVGEAGIEATERRLILEYLLTQDALPAIDSLTYMKQWGQASEPKRLEKLRWVISTLMHEKWGMGEYDKAVREWKSDLCYIAKGKLAERRVCISKPQPE